MTAPGSDWPPRDDVPTTEATALEWIKQGRAFDEQVLRFAARFAVGTETFQALLGAVKAAGKSTRDFRDGVKPYRKLRAVGPDERAEADPVRSALLYDGSRMRRSVANATTIFALDPRWSEVIAYQALSDRVVKLKAPAWHEHEAPALADTGAWTDADTTRAQAWIAREYSLDLGADIVNAAVQATAERHVVDPLRDYFASLADTWDGTRRLPTWLSVVFGAPCSEYIQAVGSRFLISAVARALRPGCKVDHVLVTEGDQGMLKSTALAKLCPDRALFFDDEIVIGDKDAAQVLRGKWIIELGELSALSRHDLAAVKAYITRAVDCYRPSFGRVSRDFPRRCVFTASTNEAEYLKDPTGNRRFWPVPVTRRADVEWIERWRDQLWVEALEALVGGAPWWLETRELEGLAREEQSQRTQGDPWDEHVAKWLDDQVKLQESEHGSWAAGNCRRCVGCVGVTVSAVLAGACSVPKERQDRAHENRVGAILRALGWQRGAQRRLDGARVRPYFPPSVTVTSSEPKTAEDVTEDVTGTSN